MLTLHSSMATTVLFFRYLLCTQVARSRSAREELTSDKSFMNFEVPENIRRREGYQRAVKGVEEGVELQPMSRATAAIPRELKYGGRSKIWLGFDNMDRISTLSYIARQTHISSESAFLDYNVLVDKEILSDPHLLISSRIRNMRPIDGKIPSLTSYLPSEYTEGAFEAYDEIKRKRYACRVSASVVETVDNRDYTVADYHVYMSRQGTTEGFHIDKLGDLISIESADNRENMEGGFDMKKLHSMTSHSKIVIDSSTHPTIDKLGDQCKAQIDSFGRTAANFLERRHESSVSKSVLNIFEWVFSGTQRCNITESMTVSYHIYPTIGNQIILGEGYLG